MTEICLQWQAGDPCRARYSNDGEIYEATIVGVNHGDASCLVRFVGYNNEEQMAQSSLLRSLGEGARKIQMREAIEVLEQVTFSISLRLTNFH